MSAPSDPSDRAIRTDEFEGLMQDLEPFESAPRLAVGLSGGADSTALALLARDWASSRGGEVVALIVDHGLRPDSADEARQVARQCRAWGVAAEILVWTGPKPGTGIEQAARDARHRLLGDACGRHAVLHLLLAHHGGDQAETIALRREAGSGSHGLAGMSACVEHAGYRVLRPLLPVAKARLVATLKARRQSWFEDPMNAEGRFARVRLRQAGVPPLADDRRARSRIAGELDLAARIPSVAGIDAYGAAFLDREAWNRLPARLARPVVARLALSVGGRNHAPRGHRLDALVRRLGRPGHVSATLGRCLWRGDGLVAVTREARHLPAVDAEGGEVLWDDRFRLVLPDGAWRIRPPGRRDLDLLRSLAGAPLPPNAVLKSLPVVDRAGELAAAPHLGYAADARAAGCRVRFAPRHMLVGPLFTNHARGTGIQHAATP